MLIKIIKRSKYLFYSLFFIIIYGFILYFTFTWLAGYSLIYAYLGNLTILILLLTADEYTIRMLQSKDLDMELMKSKTGKKTYSSIQWSLDNIVSFKTELYLFYIFILIASQIIDFDPTLVDDNLTNFILANNYSVLVLLAFDMLIIQFSKDKERIKKISTKFKKHLNENQD